MEEVPVEKLTVTHLSNTFPHLLCIRQINTVEKWVFKNYMNTDQTPPYHISLRSTLMHDFHMFLGLPDGPFPSGYLYNTLCRADERCLGGYWGILRRVLRTDVSEEYIASIFRAIEAIFPVRRGAYPSCEVGTFRILST
jgi:hypothetical protein